MSGKAQSYYLYSARPDLIREWHPSLNGRLNSRNVYINHREAVWWICEKGHEWEDTIKSRIAGKGCSACLKEFVREKYSGNRPDLFQQTIHSDQRLVFKKNHVFEKDTLQRYESFNYRKGARYECKITAMLEDPHSGKSLYAQLQNISLGGMMVETPHLFEVGDKVTIAFELTSFCNPVKLKGEVVWSTPDGMGIKFIENDEKKIAELKEAISSIENE